MYSPCTDIIQSINNSWQLQLKTSLTEEDLVKALALHINELIVHDFQRLITMLYILDVSEEKLKTIVNQLKTDNRQLITISAHPQLLFFL